MFDVVDSNKHYWYHYDALGSVVALSNNGSIEAQYSYDMFGGTIVARRTKKIWLIREMRR